MPFLIWGDVMTIPTPNRDAENAAHPHGAGPWLGLEDVQPPGAGLRWSPWAASSWASCPLCLPMYWEDMGSEKSSAFTTVQSFTWPHVVYNKPLWEASISEGIDHPCGFPKSNHLPELKYETHSQRRPPAWTSQGRQWGVPGSHPGM